MPQQVVEFGSDPAWSPRGDELVFTSDAGGMASQSVLWMVRKDGTGRRQLTHFGKPAGGHRAPVLVARRPPRRLHRLAGRLDERDLDHRRSASGAHAPRRGRTRRRGSRASRPTIGDSTGAARAARATAACGATRSTADGTPRGSEEVVVPLDAGIVNGVSLSASGTIAFGLVTEDSNLWAVDIGADGAALEPRRLTDDVVAQHASRLLRRRAHRLLSDVRRLAAVGVADARRRDRRARRSSPGTGSLAIRNGRRTRSRVLVGRGPMTARATWPGWTSRRAASRRSPSLWRACGSRASRRTGASWRFTSIAPDGVMNVWTQRLDGPRVRRSRADPEAVSYPDWSPDGLSLAVEIKRGDQTHIGVVARDGGPVDAADAERGQSWPHSWAPDNDRIAFAGERDGVWNVYTVSRRTRAVTALTRFTSPERLRALPRVVAARPRASCSNAR